MRHCNAIKQDFGQSQVKKIANQPITTAVSENPVTKKGHDWLLGNFLFGTEIGEGQLKKTTLYKEKRVNATRVFTTKELKSAYSLQG